jgi:hypothetical protein
MTSNDAFLTWWREYERTGKLGAVHLGMTREDLRQLFGEPDDTAKGFRKRPLSGIWKYGEIEFHFGFEGELFLIFIDGWDEVVSPRVIAQATPPTREQLRIMGHDEASRLKSLATKAGLPEHRLRFYAHADETIFSTVQHGIVFIMAFWSGPAHSALKLLGETIRQLDLEERLELVILDTDGIPRLYDHPPFGDDQSTKLGGHGEAAWFRDGCVESVYTGDLGAPESFYENFTKKLLT